MLNNLGEPVFDLSSTKNNLDRDTTPTECGLTLLPNNTVVKWFLSVPSCEGLVFDSPLGLGGVCAQCLGNQWFKDLTFYLAWGWVCQLTSIASSEGEECGSV